MEKTTATRQRLANPADIPVILCKAKTRRGKACKNRPQANTIYCGPHQPDEPNEPAETPAAAPLPKTTAHATPAELDAMKKRIAHKIDLAAQDKEDKDRHPELTDPPPVRAVSPSPTPTTLQPRTIMITGSRENIAEERTKNHFTQWLKNQPHQPFVLVPDTKGTCRILIAVLKETRTPHEVVAAKWTTPRGMKRPAAGFERTEEMIKRVSELIVYWDGDESRKSGSFHSIRTAAEKQIPTTVHRLDHWEGERAAAEAEAIRANAYTDPEATVKGAFFTFTQIQNANRYHNDIRIISRKFPDFMYCARGKRFTAWKRSPLANPYPAVKGKPGATLPKYRAWLWKLIKARDILTLYTLAKIRPSTALLCHCSEPENCHLSEIINVCNWLHHTEKGKKFLMPRERIRDIEVCRDPVQLAKLDPAEREKITRRTVIMREVNAIRQTTATPDPNKAKQGKQKYSPNKPYKIGQKVIYINGELSIPMTIRSVDYDAWDFTKDFATGIRRNKILHMELFNAQLRTRLHWSDAEHETHATKMEPHNDEYGNSQPVIPYQKPRPGDDGEGRQYTHLLPTVSAYIDPNSLPAREIVTPDLTRKARIQVGDIVQERDTLTDNLIGIYRVTKTATAIWYKVTAKAPAVLDVWTAALDPLDATKAHRWKANGGSQLHKIR